MYGEYADLLHAQWIQGISQLSKDSVIPFMSIDTELLAELSDDAAGFLICRTAYSTALAQNLSVFLRNCTAIATHGSSQRRTEILQSITVKYLGGNIH